MWIREACFVNPELLEPIEISKIPAGRWKLVCTICQKRIGACIQCYEKYCYKAFHVTCAQKENYLINAHETENGETFGYCERHIPTEISEKRPPKKKLYNKTY